jgi:hypothetical protein
MKLINANESNRAAYTPSEFAALFGREKTWTYRQLYSGRLKSIKGHGGQLIPTSEAERIVSGAEYLDVPRSGLNISTRRRINAKKGQYGYGLNSNVEDNVD